MKDMKMKIIVMIMIFTSFFASVARAEELETIVYNIDMEDVLWFDGDDFYNAVDSAIDAVGKELLYIELNSIPDESQGTLYFYYSGKDRVKVKKGDEFKYGNFDEISKISFIPKESGKTVIKYRGYYTATKCYEGEIVINVAEILSKDIDVIRYTVDTNDKLKFNASDFRDAFEDVGTELLYIEFKNVPSKKQGALWFDYEGTEGFKIERGDELYDDGAFGIFDITFVPKPSYSGEISIKYSGYYTNSKYYSGEIIINVNASDSAVDDKFAVEPLGYTINNDDELEFDGDDFSDIFQDVGAKLLYIELETIPSMEEGTLYYDYDGEDEQVIAKGDKFYYDDDPNISDITFLPNLYSRAVCINYKGYYAKDKYIEGKICIRIKNAKSDDKIKTISIKEISGEEVYINASNLNCVIKEGSGNNLNYIEFLQIIPSDTGMLYYDYGGSEERTVSADDKFYYGGKERISKVSFVPKKGYTGVIIIKYHAHEREDIYCQGEIEITYEKGNPSITHKDVSGAGVRFEATDFENVSKKITGESCEAIRLGVIAGSAGKLYLNYGQADQKPITAGTTFYIDKMPDIANVTFVPSAGFKGITTISYIGINNRGEPFTAYIKIYVTGKSAELEKPTIVFADVAEDSWYKDIVYKVCEAELMKGTGDTTFNPEGNMTVAEAITMACRVHNQAKGGKDADFVAYGNNWYDVYVNYAIVNGIIKYGDFADYTVNATRAEMAYIFYHSVTSDKLIAINAWIVPDVDKNDLYGVEIYALYDAGILAGDAGTGNFRSGDNVIRAEAATILARLGGIIDRVKK